MSDVNEMEINAGIKKYLENNGITQSFISRKTGIAHPKLSLSLNGDRKLTLGEYTAICSALGVGTETFLELRVSDKEAV